MSSKCHICQAWRRAIRGQIRGQIRGRCVLRDARLCGPIYQPKLLNRVRPSPLHGHEGVTKAIILLPHFLLSQRY